MTRPLEDVLFGDLTRKAQPATRAVTVTAPAALLLLLAATVYRFHAAGQFEGRLWEFFAWQTTWEFLGKGLLGTLASGAGAAGNALGSNPIPIVVPCHRVVHAGGGLGGYTGGLERKRYLLRLEGARS